MRQWMLTPFILDDSLLTCSGLLLKTNTGTVSEMMSGQALLQETARLIVCQIQSLLQAACMLKAQGHRDDDLEIDVCLQLQ